MSRKQRLVVIVGAAMFVLAGLVPPWVFVSRDGNVKIVVPLSYGVICWPPREGVLDTGRLFTEWACILVATGAGFLAMRRPNTR